MPSAAGPRKVGGVSGHSVSTKKEGKSNFISALGEAESKGGWGRQRKRLVLCGCAGAN